MGASEILTRVLYPRSYISNTIFNFTKRCRLQQIVYSRTQAFDGKQCTNVQCWPLPQLRNPLGQTQTVASVQEMLSWNASVSISIRCALSSHGGCSLCCDTGPMVAVPLTLTERVDSNNPDQVRVTMLFVFMQRSRDASHCLAHTLSLIP